MSDSLQTSAKPPHRHPCLDCSVVVDCPGPPCAAPSTMAVVRCEPCRKKMGGQPLRLLLKSEPTTPPHTRTPGQLWINDRWHCYTLEDLVREPGFDGRPLAADRARPTIRPNEKPETYFARLDAWVRSWKVPGETALPSGVFEVRMTWSPKFKRLLPEIFGTPGFTATRLHGADSERDVEGCIGVGDKPATVPGFGRSDLVLAELCLAIREAEKRKEGIAIDIQRGALLPLAAGVPIPEELAR